MKNNTVDTTAAIVAFPASLMERGVSLAKSQMKGQFKIGLFRADAILQGVDDVELLKACYVAAGYTARDSRSSVTNSDKYLAAALMVREGEMSEKEYLALSTAEASAAFKAAGGARGEGRNPAAWKQARIDLAKQAAGEKAGEARPPSGDEKDKPSLSAYQILSAAISLRKGELNPNEKALLVDQLLA